MVLDTIEVLYAGLSNSGIIRAELRRLFRWLKDKGVTTIVTGERAGDSMLTRHGLEEYVSDCVIFLDNRVAEELSTRRLRIVKYRGSAHSTNEFPFIIDERGFSVIPANLVKLEYPVSDERVPTGISSLDAMLGGKGYLKGTSILVSGMVGTGKSSLAAALVDAACARGDKCLYLAFEEAPAQIIRNMKSIGIDLSRWEKKGLLRFSAARPSEQGLEKHLVSVERSTDDFKPALVIVDALTDFLTLGSELEVRQMVLRLVDFLKAKSVSAMFTSMAGQQTGDETGIGLSSAFDTWIHLTNVQENNERTRTLVVIKSRGMAHSNQVREFIISDKGVDLTDIYTSAAGSFMGSARLAQMAVDRAEGIVRREGIHARERQIEEKRRALEAQITALRAEFEADARESEIAIREEQRRDKALAIEMQSLVHHRRNQRESRKKENKH